MFSMACCTTKATWKSGSISTRRSVHAVNVVGQQHNDIHRSVYKHYRLYHMHTGQARSAQPVHWMPRSGMEAPAESEYGTAGEWRRSPAQPVILLIGYINPPLSPARQKPAKSDTEACVRCRSGHDKAKP